MITMKTPEQAKGKFLLPIDGPDTIPRVSSGESLPTTPGKTLKQFYKNVPQKVL
jgi:hypothetical protein